MANEQHNKTDLLPGLIISYFGNSVAVEVENGEVFQCQLRRNQELPVVGDQVLFQLEANEAGRIESILPRRSLLSRGDQHGKSKPIAANVDAIVIVMAPAPIFSEYLVDRYLIAAELLNIAPIIVINKMDLLSEQDLEIAKAQLDTYQKIPYPAIFPSIYTEDGLVALAEQLKDKTAVLVGPSGVGKSSIINTIGNDDIIRVGEVTAKGAGKHTTTATRLYHLNQGGRLIDSPGVREFNLWQVSKDDLLRGFKEFNQYHGCKFRDCVHMVEPGCAIIAAVESGKINKKRYESYQTLMKLQKK